MLNRRVLPDPTQTPHIVKPAKNVKLPLQILEIERVKFVAESIASLIRNLNHIHVHFRFGKQFAALSMLPTELKIERDQSVIERLVRDLEFDDRFHVCELHDAKNGGYRIRKMHL